MIVIEFGAMGGCVKREGCVSVVYARFMLDIY